jgi:hypothetical protein
MFLFLSEVGPSFPSDALQSCFFYYFATLSFPKFFLWNDSIERKKLGSRRSRTRRGLLTEGTSQQGNKGAREGNRKQGGKGTRDGHTAMVLSASPQGRKARRAYVPFSGIISFQYQH